MISGGLDFSGRLGITHHAIERFQQHYPDAQKAELAEAVKEGTELESDLMLTILSRHFPGQIRGTRNSQFILHKQMTGIFVLATNQDDKFEKNSVPIERHTHWVVVTYLRCDKVMRCSQSKLLGQ